MMYVIQLWCKHIGYFSVRLVCVRAQKFKIRVYIEPTLNAVGSGKVTDCM